MLIPHSRLPLQTHVYVLVDVHLRSFSGICSHLTVDTHTSTELHKKSLFYMWLYGPVFRLPGSSLVTTITRENVTPFSRRRTETCKPQLEKKIGSFSVSHGYDQRPCE